MNSTKTAIMAMIIAFVAIIGMTGLAMAGSTTQTYVGDGTYTTSWNGNHGTMDIYTSTSNGQDHLSVDYQNGRSTGTQTGSTYGWTILSRDVDTYCRDTAITATTLDNSFDIIEVDMSTERGRLSLEQMVFVKSDTPSGDGVISLHDIEARGRNYEISVTALGGYDDHGTQYWTNDDTHDAVTILDLTGKVKADVWGFAAAGSSSTVAASGQAFIVDVRGSGEADITGIGGNVGTGSFIYTEGMKIRNDGTTYYSDASDETYINLNDIHNRKYKASGYIYAVTP